MITDHAKLIADDRVSEWVRDQMEGGSEATGGAWGKGAWLKWAVHGLRAALFLSSLQLLHGIASACLVCDALRVSIG